MNLKKRLILTISQNLGIEENKITPKTDFFNDLNISHLELMDLILACQKQFNINLQEESLNQIQTVDDLIKIVEKNLDEI